MRQGVHRETERPMQDRIKEHDRDIRFARATPNTSRSGTDFTLTTSAGIVV